MKRFLSILIYVLIPILPFCLEAFDSTYSMKIVKSYGFDLPPSLSSDFWRSANIITFDNGLKATIWNNWKHESQAKQMSEWKYSGIVNLIPYIDLIPIKIIDYMIYEQKQRFEMDGKNSGCWESSVNLTYEPEENSKKPLRIVSLIENVETISSGFSDSYKYRYTIQLSDGTTWIDERNPDNKWETPWKEKTAVVVIGTREKPVFLRLRKTSGYLREEDCLEVKKVLEKMQP